MSQTLELMRFTIHAGLKVTQFELHHGRNPRVELTNSFNDNKSSVFD